VGLYVLTIPFATLTAASVSPCRTALYAQIDVDRNGLLTVDELSSVLGEDNESAAKMIQSADKNGDGQICFDEFLDLWLKREEDVQQELTKDVQQALKATQDNQPDLPPGAARKK